MRVFLLSLICLFLFVTPVKATRVLSITSDKSTLLGDEEMQINASASGFSPDETIFVKGAFFQDGSTNYFGLTKFGDDWLKNSASVSDQYQTKISDWNSNLLVKSDFSDSGFKGNGEYKFKVGFYYTTSGGNLSSVNWSENILTISLSAPIPTSTPSPQPTKSPTPVPTITPSPLPTKTPTPISSPLIKPTSTPKATTSDANNNAVLGIENTILLASPVLESTKSSDGKNSNIIIAIILVGLGVVFISTSIYMAYKTSELSKV